MARSSNDESAWTATRPIVDIKSPVARGRWRVIAWQSLDTDAVQFAAMLGRARGFPDTG